MKWDIVNKIRNYMQVLNIGIFLTTKKGLQLESFFHVRGVLVLISNETCI